MKRPRANAAWLAAAAGLLLAGATAIVAGAATETGTVLVPTVPERVLDTRQPGAVFDVLTEQEVGTLPFGGLVPAEARAVQLNITVVAGSQPSFLTAWPTGESRPGSSTMNWSDGGAYPNGATVKLGSGLSVDFFNRFGQVHVIVDLMGYYLDAPLGGPAGPAGAQGPPGADGADGAPGLAGIEVAEAQQVLGAPGAFSVTADCPSGKSVLSGGFDVSVDVGALDGSALENGPVGTTGWRLAGTSTVAQTIEVSAVCATVAP